MSNEERFIIARWAYAIGKDFISDVEYDHLEQEIKNNSTLQEYVNRGWSEDPCPYELLSKYNLDEFIVPVIFSHSTESIESLNTEELVRERLSSISGTSRLSYKLDGFNLRLNYYNGHFVSARTRNRNEGTAKDLTPLSDLFIKEIPLKGKVLITGELYIKNKGFEEYKKLRGIISQRNGVASAIANGDVEFLGYRCYNIYSEDNEQCGGDKYRLLQEMGFPTPKFVQVRDYASLLKGIQVLGMQKKYYDAPTDGLVLENDTMQYALRIGAWKEECNFSYVTGYTVNRGIYGNNFLVAIKPIFVNNKTVSEIDIDNIQNIIDYNLRIGYPIAFTERSAVNSIIDSTKTAELQSTWSGRYDKYKAMVDEKYK